MNIAVVGTGAFGLKHLDALANIDNVEVTCVVGSNMKSAQEVADKYKIASATDNYIEMLQRKDIDAVILVTPTQMHAQQTIDALEAGKHVQVEIPLADNWVDAQRVAKVQRSTGLIAMVGHTRRFNPSHQYLHQKFVKKEISIQQMDVQTYFFRRTNMNALGKPRSWTDHLLWHHSAHTIDLFQYQTGEKIVKVNAIQGPKNPDLGIAMDMSIQLKTETGKICTLSLSFNNDGPLGTFFRYICDNGTYIARYDDLVNGNEEKIDVSKVAISVNGIELQDREFVSSILESREPNASVASVLSTYEIMDQIQSQLEY